MRDTDSQAAAWDEEVDLVVVGAGAGGMGCALVAALEGLKPVLVEKSSQVGGTMSTSAGTLWIPGNTQSRDAGFHDTAEAADTYMQALTGAPDPSGRRAAFLESGPQMIDYLRARSDVQFVPCGKHPDYRDMPGAAVTGRAVAPALFDGRLLGRDFERVRPPIPEFMVLGGMMAGKADIPRLINRFGSVADFLYAGRLFLRYVADRLRFSRGTRLVMGNALAARLFHSLRQQQVPVLFDSTVREVVREGGRITGVVLDVAGTTRRIRARKGVVLATGGYGHNAAMRRQFMPAPTPPLSVACPMNTGDGIGLGQRLGAAVRPETQGPGAFWTPVSRTRRRDGSEGVYPHLSLDRAKPGLIAVNGAGRRFVNEAASYHDFVEGMYASHRSAPTMPAWLVCEAGFVRRYGLGAVHPGTRDLGPAEREGYLVTAPTLEALAGRIGVDPDALVATVSRYNGMARAGRDLDFGKGDSELNRFNGDPAVQPNPCLAPIAQGPFVAVAVWPAEIGTSTGMETDFNGRVLDAQGHPIGGLYACGADMASVMLGTYPGPGTTLGPALTFGYRIALHAAGRLDDALPAAAPRPAPAAAAA